MSRIVLDVNMLIENPGPAPKFSSVSGWELVATDRLFEELYTHRYKGKPYLKDDTSRKAYLALKKVVSVVPMIHFVDPFRFEIEMGQSASTMKAEQVVIQSNVPMPSDEELKTMQLQKSKMEQILQFKHPPECEQAYQSLRGLQADDKLFPYLAQLLSGPKAVDYMQKHALEEGREFAINNGWTVATTFKPARDWLSCGLELAIMAYMLWKYARHGDSHPAKAATHSYDLIYVAYMAICDGLVSNDSTILKLAWACWPDKRQNIWTYDRHDGEIVRYLPLWER